MNDKTGTSEKNKAKLLGMLAVTAAITVAITFALMFAAQATGGFAAARPGRPAQVTWPIAIHLATVLPALFVGGIILLRPKGTRFHRLLGRAYCALMLVTATATLFIRAPGGGIAGTGYSPIHAFTVFTYFAIPYAVWAIRSGRVQWHREAMMGSYAGLCIAGAFSLIPGRLMWSWIIA